MGMRRGPPGPLDKEDNQRSRPMKVLLGRMIHYLGGFRKVVMIGAIFSLLASLLSVVVPIVLTNGIDAVVPGDTALRTLFILVIAYLILSLTSWILSSLKTWVLSGAQAGLVCAVQKDVYDHLIYADLSFYKSQQSGNITSRIATDTDSLSLGIQVLIEFASQIVFLVAIFFTLWITSPLIAITSLVVVPGVIFISFMFGTVGQRIMLSSQRAYGEVSGQIAENLSGIHVAKAFNREKELADNISILNEKAYKYGFKFSVLMGILMPLMRAFGTVGVAAILFVGASLAVGVNPILTIGEVVLGVILVNQFMMPLLSLSMLFSRVQASMAAMDRISDVLESKPAISDSENVVELRSDSDGISFENLTFSYIEGIPVLNDISFRIKSGEMVALVGHTGAGKTTIASLINRFYDPQQGRICIGNQVIRSISLESLHDAVSLIPQEPYLFDDTIIENIRYGKPEAKDEEIKKLCEILGANEFIEVLADGYQTKIIESGKNLSSGQKQMITIARTMLANPRILILDEATSRLDAYSESLVQDAQALLFQNRTTVVIAHRLTTITNASRIFVFDHGKLVEQGTHDELLKMGGIFKGLYDTYYTHQGIEQISESTAQIAEAEIAKYGSIEKTDSSDLQMTSATLNPETKEDS